MAARRRRRDALRVIPNRASVAANTPLIPLLAQRRAVVRFLHHALCGRHGNRATRGLGRRGPDLIERYGVAFRSDWRQLRSSRRWLEQHRNMYVVQALNDGVAVLQRQGPIHPGLEQKLDDVLRRPLPLDPRKRKT